MKRTNRTLTISLALAAIGALVACDMVGAQGRGRGGRARGGGQPARGPGWGNQAPAGGRGRGAGPGACMWAQAAQPGQWRCALPAASGEPLDSQQAEQLKQMRQEEKLARDVYQTLASKWNVPQFANIRQAEARHMDALVMLLKRYQIQDPITDYTVGTFSDPQYEKQYEQLVAQGSKSLVEAYRVGAEIEERDIADLRAASKITEQQDVRFVYDNLERASRNHLRRFLAMLEGLQQPYEAKHLEQAELERIADSDIERGGGWGAANWRGPGPRAGMGRQGGPGRGRGMGPGAGQGRGRGMGSGAGRRGRGMGGPGYGRAGGWN